MVTTTVRILALFYARTSRVLKNPFRGQNVRVSGFGIWAVFALFALFQHPARSASFQTPHSCEQQTSRTIYELRGLGLRLSPDNR